MENEVIIEKVNFSEWAAPIASSMKMNGSVRLCEDFTTGLNKNIMVYLYPLPKINDIFAKLTGGVRFTVADLASGY